MGQPEMKPFSCLVLFLTFFITFTAYSQTACFETEKVPMMDIIELEENIKAQLISEKMNKVAPKGDVRQTVLNNYSMNGGAEENVTSFYYKNEKGEDVAHYSYRGKEFYRVRNLQNGCTALYGCDPSSKSIILLSSLPADQSDGFLKNGQLTSNYKDKNLDVTKATNSSTSQAEECRIVNGGSTIFSAESNMCGKVKFCALEYICRGKEGTQKTFCKAIDDKCPALKDCINDKAFATLSEDFKEGTIKKEIKASAQ